MSLITKRRLASLASASALIATMAVAAAPAATLAASLHRDRVHARRHQPHRRPDRRGGHRRARRDRLRHRCLQPDAASPTLTSTALSYYGVVVNGAQRQRDQQQGPRASASSPFDGTQHGRAILYINGASGTISGNQVYDFQKNGIEVIGLDRRWQRSRQRHDLRDGQEQRRHRRGSHRRHRPERHRDQERRERHREEQHRQRLQLHAGRTPRPRACCSIRTAGTLHSVGQQVRRQRGEHLRLRPTGGHVKP